MEYKSIRVIKKTGGVDVDLYKCISLSPTERIDTPTIELRTDGELVGVSFYLAREYDWILGEDSTGTVVLVPQKKE